MVENDPRHGRTFAGIGCRRPDGEFRLANRLASLPRAHAYGRCVGLGFGVAAEKEVQRCGLIFPVPPAAILGDHSSTFEPPIEPADPVPEV